MVTPSASFADWVAEAVGSAVDAVDDPMPGASTATIWPVRAGGREFIVKVYDLGIEGMGADDIQRDAAAMRAAAGVGLVAPRVIATDETGTRLGSPAIVMTRLPGAPRVHGGSDPEAWVDGLADVLVSIGTAPLPSESLPERRPWFSLPVPVPPWTSDPGPWRAMTEALAEPLPSGPVGFIHRDFHHLNVVWVGPEAVGPVDWVNGCLGPIESDIACCRINIMAAEDARGGLELADRFLARCREAGLSWHPAWDLEWLAGIEGIERLVATNAALGARSTLARTSAIFDEAAVRALDAVDRWNR